MTRMGRPPRKPLTAGRHKVEVVLTDRELEHLDRLSEKLGVSRPEAIRIALRLAAPSGRTTGPGHTR